MSPTEILKKYWNYDSFRKGQLEVIEATIAGKDTLALFPTGGGKSICFQVAGLLLEGVTLVVSPLIALMKDQVEGLQNKDIPAIALHSGMSWKEMKLCMENALKGRYKFIYISPERLSSENFREYLPNLNITLLAVDEAHCISQWGYDFRPPYLKIAECRDLIPKLKIAAFTASAPPLVQTDICQKLNFKSPFVFAAPFRRPNLHFHVMSTENKTGLLLKALKRATGCSIVFCDTRRETEEIARFLKENNISCDHYHAGLTASARSRRQENWMTNKSRVMVCTNAFGMGVDKPDVRFVFHLSPPMLPEGYYQEAGRAGRDGKDSWCMLFYKPQDMVELNEKLLRAFPPAKELERMYTAVCNYFSISAGAGVDQTYDFDLNAIADKYKLPQSMLFYAVSNIETLGYWSLSDGFYSPARLLFKATYEEVYDYKLRNPVYEDLIDVILRSYGGIFESFVKINEKQIATRLRIELAKLTSMLGQLHKENIVEYIPNSDKPKITFIEPRSAYPEFKTGLLEPIRQARVKGLQTMQAYLNEKECRAVFWEKYYGGKTSENCGHCDICLKRKKTDLSSHSAEIWTLKIQEMLTEKQLTRTELLEKFPAKNGFELREILRWLMDNKKIMVTPNQKLFWKK